MDKLEVFKTLNTFIPEGQLMEIRAISSVKKGDIWSGYFKDKNILWDSIQRFDKSYNIYFVLNVINDVCYSTLQHDQMVWGAETTKDKDIVARNWVLIDLDTERNGKKVSSTDEEWQKARMKAHEIRNFLRDKGFSYPVVCHSGNGIHLDYKIDSWANTEENETIIEKFLKALSALFSDEDVKVDTVVKNAARVDKLYGTYARKGANTKERPHRMSKILVIPDDLKCTDKEYFIKIGNILPDDNPVHDYNQMRTYDKFDIDEFIKKHNIEITKDVTNAGIRKLVLKECPFDSSHKSPDAALFVMPNGAIGFSCFHQSCGQYTFKDFRLKYEPDAYDKKDYREFQYKQRNYGHSEVKPFVPSAETEEKGKKWLSMTDVKRVNITELMSIPTGYHDLDKKIIGLFAGELSVLSGLNASGKTSFLDCLALNVVQKGYKVAIWSGEMQDWRFQGWIDQMAAGKNYVKKKEGYENFYYCPNKTAEKINEWMGDKLFLYNNAYGSNWQQIFSDVKELVDKEGTQLVILDNLAALSIDSYDGEKYSKQTKFIIELKEFAKQKNIHVILVCHPRKENFFLRKESISGTADLTNIADNVFLIHRVGKDFEVRAGEFFGKERVQDYLQYSTVLEVAKNRQLGIVDYLVGMYYEVESRRLKNSVAEHIVYGWQEEPEQADIPSTFDDSFNSFANNPLFEESEEAPF